MKHSLHSNMEPTNTGPKLVDEGGPQTTVEGTHLFVQSV